MSRLPKQLLVLLLLVVVALSTSGCFLRSMIGHHFVGTLGEDVELNIAAFRANVTTGVCLQDDFHTGGLVQCTYYFASEELFPEVTSTAQLIADFGLFGVLVDPLILQVPDDASNFVATFYDGVSIRPLDVTLADSFPVTPAITVPAEPGQQFLILELPADVVASLPEGDPRLGPQFDFNLEFQLADDDPLVVKAMYTGKVEGDGQTFYIPLLPCTTDFAAVPSFTVPQSQLPVLLLDQIISMVIQNADMACDGQVYDLRSEPGAAHVLIDVKPGDDNNAINPRNKGVIPVAILTTSLADGDALDFDATSVDPLSVRFGRDGAGEAHGRGHIEDVDGDGDNDLVLHFRTRETGLQCGDTEIRLTAETFDGRAVEGVDSVTTVGCK